MTIRFCKPALLALAAFGVAACHRQTPTPSRGPGSATTPIPARAEGRTPPDFAAQPVQTLEGKALWYDVPDSSLAARRAWAGEMTAASDKLPQNTYARVTRLDPGKNGGTTPVVVVRVTDKSLGRRDALIEVDRDAADALGIVKEGEAKVRVEVLALKNATADKPAAKPDQPDGPKASEISRQPAKDDKAEKRASLEKSGEKGEK